MRKLLLASVACAVLVAPATVAGGATAAAAAEPPPPGPSVTIHHVAPVLLYRLEERLPDGQQLDGGTIRVTYTCRPGDLDRLSASAFAFAGDFLPPTFGDDVPCDGTRHTVRLGVSRKTASPYTPPGRFEDTEVFVGFDTGPGGEIIPGDVTQPVRIRYLGF